MLKIGLVDHHLNNYHSDTFLRLANTTLSNEQVKISFAWESNPTGDDWCLKNNVKKCASPEEVTKESDVIMVMAPDNVDFHKEFCQKVLPFKKPTFIDKFLSQSYAEAGVIVNLAKQSGTPIMSSSALAFAVELEQLLDSIPKEPTEMFSRGLGKWAGYGIHTIAPILRVMGTDFKRLIDTGTPTAHTVTLDYGQERQAVIEVRNAENEWDFFPWQFGVRVGDKYVGATVKDFDGFYTNLMKRIIQFFKTGQSAFPIDSSLAAVRILEDSVKSQQINGQWLTY